MKVFHVRPARHGLGLFATRAIAPGKTITHVRGPVITYAQVLRMKTPDNAFQFSRNRYIDFRRPGVLANHSCEPNAGVTPKRELVAIKPIRKGQEITYDYSACMDKDTVCDFTCLCRKKTCRKTIKGFATLPAKKRKDYMRRGIVQAFLRKEKI